MKIDWPELPDGAEILWENDDSECPQRFLIEPHGDGFRFTTINQLFSRGEAPSVSANQVLEIANKLIAFIARQDADHS